MMRFALVAATGLVLAAVGPAGPQKVEAPSKEDIDKAKAEVKAFQDKIKDKNGQILYLGNDALHAAFPKHLFFAVRYRIYPVAMQLPEGMRPSNILVVAPGERAEHLKDAKALENYFKTKLAPVKKLANATPALLSWLTLTQEFHQDGFYKFKLPDAVGGSEGKEDVVALGSAVVMSGGNGVIEARLEFGKDGKLVLAGDTAKIKEGPRPICQATKLLDADPLVRRIVEQDLLYLGRAAFDYLQEQRTLARPELRQAIDRIVERILRDER